LVSFAGLLLIPFFNFRGVGLFGEIKYGFYQTIVFDFISSFTWRLW